MFIMRSKIAISTAQTLYITVEKHVIAILNNRKENQGVYIFYSMFNLLQKGNKHTHTLFISFDLLGKHTSLLTLQKTRRSNG